MHSVSLQSYFNTLLSTHNNALVGLDYENPKQHKLIIPPGSISTTATIIIINDHTSEPTEEFKLTIVPEGVMQLIPQAEAVIYIVDADCESFPVFAWCEDKNYFQLCIFCTISVQAVVKCTYTNRVICANQ